MPRDRGGLGRTGGKHRRKISPLVPSSAARGGNDSRTRSARRQSAVAKPPKRSRCAASPPTRLQVMLEDAKRAAILAIYDLDEAEERYDNAYSVSQEKYNKIQEFKQNYSHTMKPPNTATKADLQAAVAADEELCKLICAAERAVHVVRDLELELEVALAQCDTTYAFFERCVAAEAARVGADGAE